MNKQTLLLDVGNSSLMSCLYADGQSKDPCYFMLEDWALFFKQFDSVALDQVVVSSVVPKFDSQLKHSFSCPIHFVTHNNIPELLVNLAQPEQVGADRLVGAYSAWKQFQTDVLVVDSGTALTFCYATDKGVYEGGLIFPGMKIASQSLNDYTAKIPLIEVAPKQEIVGKTTQEAVESGLYHGYIALINGIVTKYRQKVPGIHVVGSGGGLDVLRDHLDLDDYDPYLVMKGLALCTQSLVLN